MELWEHQKKAIDRAKVSNWVPLLFKTGKGKTRAMIEIIRHRFNFEQRLMRTLIFAPLSVCAQWKLEFEKFSKIPQENIHVLIQSGKKRIEELKRAKKGIVITNYESVNMEEFFAALVAWKAEILVCDEIHWLKDPSSKRSKKVLVIAEQTPYRYGLTGTPIVNSEMDVFGQYRILDLGKHFGTNFFVFRKMYFRDKNAGMPKQKYFPKWEVKPESRAYFTKVLAETAIQSPSTFEGMKPLMTIPRPVTMSPEHARLYDQMERQLLVELDGAVMTAEFAMTKSLRLQQILCGFIQDEEKDVKWVKDNHRLNALEELLDSIGKEKTIVWSVFKPTYGKIGEVCDRLGYSYKFLTGEQTQTEKNDAVESFTKGDTQILISNPASGGTGLNLQVAPYSVYFGRTYNLAHFIQSQARNYREGSQIHEQVIHYDMYVPGTVDEIIMNALQRKQTIGNVLLNWAKEKLATVRE